MDASYVMPLRRHRMEPGDDLASYLEHLTGHLEVIVVDGSPADLFAWHHSHLPDGALHIPVDPTRQTPNGKVGGILTGLAHASHERVIIADDDVRYDLPDELFSWWVSILIVPDFPDALNCRPWSSMRGSSASVSERRVGTIACGNLFGHVIVPCRAARTQC